MSYISNIRRFGNQFSGSGTAVLSDDQLRSIAPSIFATEKHESRSDRFAYIPTFKVVDAMRAEGFVPVRAVQGNSRIAGKADFTKHMLRFRKADDVGRQDLGGAFPEVVLLNAHDGTSSYRLMAGIFRMVCTNGMVVRERNDGDLTIAHKGDVVSKVIEGSFEILKQSTRAIEAAETWSQLRLEREEQVILAEAAHALRFDEDSTQAEAISPPQLLRARRVEDQGNSLWTTFNRLQENTVRGGMTGYARNADGHRRTVTARAVNGIDGDVKLNRALWLLTERMAAIKTGTDAPMAMAA